MSQDAEPCSHCAGIPSVTGAQSCPFHPCNSPYKTDRPEIVSIHHLVYSRVVERVNVSEFKTHQALPGDQCHRVHHPGAAKRSLGIPHLCLASPEQQLRTAGTKLYLLHVLHLRYFHGTTYVVIITIIWMPTHFPNRCINSKMLYKHTLYSTHGRQANSSHNNWPVVS